MKLDVVSFGSRENGNKDKKIVRAEPRRTCTDFDSYH